MSEKGDRKPFNVTCGKCQHVWPAIYVPMEMGLAATVLKSMRCPMCGVAAKHIFMASETKPAA